MTQTAINPETVWAALHQVMDPEIGCNLVDLGLIYDVTVSGPTVNVTMTLTTQGCPMHQSLAEGVQQAVLQVPGVEEANVQVVWDPPWNQCMITEAGRDQLGLR